MTQSVTPPSLKRRIPGAATIQFMNDPIGLLTEIKGIGDIVRLGVGGDKAYLLTNPTHIKRVLITDNSKFIKSKGLRVTKRLLGNGLLTSEGDFHARQRRLIQPAFNHQRIAVYAETMVDYTVRQTSKWRGGETVDIHSEMMRLTLAIVAKALFNSDVESSSRGVGEALEASLQNFQRFLNPAGALLDKLPIPSTKRFQRAKKNLDALIYGIIEQRRKSGEDPGDLLSMLLNAQDSEGDGTGMTDAQLRDEAMTLLLAGHETTANALTWTWYLLSQNPEKERKLHEELDSVLNGRAPRMADVPELKYTSMVLNESMRIYPPAWVVAREAVEEIELGGYTLPKGSVLIMSQYVMNHDPRYFKDPEEFRPERWTPEMRNALEKVTYFPFGAGARSCVGEPFAQMEGVLLIAAIAQGWKFRLSPGQRIGLLPRITLRPKYGMRMKLLKRAS